MSRLIAIKSVKFLTFPMQSRLGCLLCERRDGSIQEFEGGLSVLGVYKAQKESGYRSQTIL